VEEDNHRGDPQRAILDQSNVEVFAPALLYLYVIYLLFRIHPVLFSKGKPVLGLAELVAVALV
jgi:hypothetical protein